MKFSLLLNQVDLLRCRVIQYFVTTYLLLFLSEPAWCAKITQPDQRSVFSETQQNPLKPEVNFSHRQGFYEQSFQLVLSSAYTSGKILFTLDGSIPDRKKGSVYSNPLLIDKTMIIRTAIWDDSVLISDVVSQSYIFAEKVLYQPASPAYPTGISYPSYWEQVRGDYEMDAEVISLEGKENIKNALLAIPSLSIVMDDSALFQVVMNGGGKNINEGYERAASMEMLYPDNPGLNFQINCGIGPRSRNLEGRAIKRGFEIMFKDTFGPGKLKFPIFFNSPRNSENAVNVFDHLILRPGFCDSWSSQGYKDAQDTYTRDPMTREAYLDVTGWGTHNHFIHLYLNGLYWGLYNLTEKINDNFLSHYLGGIEEDWLVVKSETDSDSDGEVNSGDPSRYKSLLGLIGGTLSRGPVKSLMNDNDYQKVCSLIDPRQFARYIIVHCYHGPGDWPDNNWYFVMRNNPALPGLFQIWDAEKSLADYDGDGRKHAWYTPLLTETNTRGGRAVPSRIWKAMISNPDFRMLFADEVYASMKKNEGPLSNENSLKRWEELTDYIGGAGKNKAAILGEAARWGDVNIDASVQVPLRYNQWLIPVEEVKTYLAKNVEEFYSEFYSLLNLPQPPEIFIQDEKVERKEWKVEGAYKIQLNNPSGLGAVYYTLNGQDPRIWGGTDRGKVFAGAETYQAPFQLSGTVHLQCRIFHNGIWSPLNTCTISSTGTDITQNNSSSIQVFPNPFYDRCSLSLPNGMGRHFYISVFNLMGRKEFCSTYNENLSEEIILSLENLSPGSYILLIHSDSDFVHRSVIIKQP